MVLITLLSAALGAEVCAEPPPAPPDALSVAWVSPLRRKVGQNGWMELVPTRELRHWVRTESGGSVARTLQHLGLRRRDKEPRRRWKVVVFDVRAADLCRPLIDADEGETVTGVAVCPEKRDDDCGRTTDLATGEEGLPLYRARWSDVARNGFCVLPAERFVQESSGE